MTGTVVLLPVAQCCSFVSSNMKLRNLPPHLGRVPDLSCNLGDCLQSQLCVAIWSEIWCVGARRRPPRAAAAAAAEAEARARARSQPASPPPPAAAGSFFNPAAAAAAAAHAVAASVAAARSKGTGEPSGRRGDSNALNGASAARGRHTKGRSRGRKEKGDSTADDGEGGDGSSGGSDGVILQSKRRRTVVDYQVCCHSPFMHPPLPPFFSSKACTLACTHALSPLPAVSVYVPQHRRASRKEMSSESRCLKGVLGSDVWYA